MNKNEIKSKMTKKKLYKSYMDLFRKKDISKITIKEITGNAGYNRGTFYLYFKDVYDINDKIKKELILEAHDNLQKIADTNISFERLFKTIVTFYTKNESSLLPFITKDSSFSSEIKQLLKPTLCKILKKDLNNKYVDYLIEYHITSVFGVVNFWVLNGKNISVDELFNLLQQIITKGVFTVIKDL